MKVVRTFFLLLIPLFLSGTALSGPLLYTTTLDTFGGTLISSNNLVTAVTTSVFDNEDGNFLYRIAFAGSTPDFSHGIVGTSLSFSDDNYLSGPAYELGTWNDTDQGNSNPGLLSDLYGLKFEAEDASNRVFGASVYDFLSDKTPMLGDIYLHAGLDFAINSNFGNCYGLNPADGIVPGCAIVPNTATTSVPEPGALSILSLGLIGLGLTRRRANAKLANL